jgi:class 3 adenylate cyclase/tetratricopeptide (TPR) repeat protein
MARMARPVMRTFLFSDLRDYTAFIETRGDQAATKMLRASRRIVREAVAKHRGAEIKTEGDSFYVVFRSPSPAVTCAIEIQRGAAAHTLRHPDVPVRMGIGINTGEAVPHDKGYVGSAVIVATRLSTSSKTGQILVTDTVRSLVRTGAHASMRDLGAWTLKGIGQAIRVYEVDPAPASAQRALGPALPLPAMLSSPARATPGLVVCPELVQREAPLAALTHHVEAAAKGEARIVAVSGEGGIGKSRLVREVAEAAHRDGMYVFGGRSHASGPPYEPIVVALRPYAHARGIEILRRLLGPLLGELRRLLPEMVVGDGHAETDVPSEERRERFLRTINLILEDAASQRPVLLVLEDFHAADEASRDLLRYLAGAFHAGICVVVTYRDEEVGPAHPLRALLAELDRERRLARVGLTPLDESGVERMTAALAPGRDTAALAHAVFERSQGVPFYVEELLKTALDDPEARPDHLALPRTIADSVRVRVSRLVGERGAGIADLLEAAAVAEIPLGYDLLVRLSDRDETEAGADLAAAIDAQLLEGPTTRSEIYQFRHALTREAVGSGIPPARRRRLHARVAAAIESIGDSEARAALLARHFAAAGDRPKALAYARQGATNAIRVGAWSTAIDLLRDAVAMASGTPDEGPVLEELASALQAAGRAAEAEEALLRAGSRARATSDATAAARVDVRLASVLRMQGRRADAVTAVTRAIDSLEGNGGELLADAVATHAALAWAENDPEEAAALATRALALAERHGATHARVSALTVLGAALCRLGNVSGRDELKEAIALGTAHGHIADAANAYLELAGALQRSAEWEAARVAAQAGADLAGQHGLEFAQANLLAQVSYVLITQGRYAEARRAAEHAVSLARPNTVAATAAKVVLADALTMLGDHAGSLALHHEVAAEVHRADPERRAFMLGSRARAELGLGRIEEAWASAQASLELATGGQRGMSVTPFLIAGDVAEAKRDPTAAREVISILDRHAARFDVRQAQVVRAELEAVARAAEGEDSAEAFASVARMYADLGVPIRAAYRRATSGLVRMDAGDGEARAEVERARSELLERGALRYLAVVDAALAKRLRPVSWIVDRAAARSPGTAKR